jgi:CheY-like chemotaxis protein
MAQTTVLVADDDSLIRTIFTEIIRGEGFESVEADNGQKALDLVNSQKIDLIFSDMNMPVMNGFELLVAVKREHPQIPITVITGFNSTYREEDAMAAGADAYITKPFKVEDIVRTLHAMSQKIQGRTPAQSMQS